MRLRKTASKQNFHLLPSSETKQHNNPNYIKHIESIHLVSCVYVLGVGGALTCNWGIGAGLLLPPCRHKHCDVMMTALQEPINSQLDALAGKHFFVAMATGHSEEEAKKHTLVFSECSPVSDA